LNLRRSFFSSAGSGFVGVLSEGSAIFVHFCLMVLMGVERFCSHFMVVVLVVQAPFVPE
jgi:hypothetical protein